jgi:hypothetical protein
MSIEYVMSVPEMKRPEKAIKITPKEGAGRSNRLGDANKNRHLQLIL